MMLQTREIVTAVGTLACAVGIGIYNAKRGHRRAALWGQLHCSGTRRGSDLTGLECR